MRSQILNVVVSVESIQQIRKAITGITHEEYR